MNIIEKATIQAYHRNRIGGAPIDALGFRGQESQTLRFEALCSWGDMSGLSVMDLGCGYGDLKPFLDERFENVQYLGIDFLQEFVDGAKERYGHLPNTQFIQSDFLTAVLPETDLVIASGSLNYRSGDALHPWKMLRKMWSIARKGLAFNLLNANVFESDGVLCGYYPDEVLKFCKLLAPKTELFSGYLVDDFTVLMTRHPGIQMTQKTDYKNSTFKTTSLR